MRNIPAANGTIDQISPQDAISLAILPVSLLTVIEGVFQAAYQSVVNGITSGAVVLRWAPTILLFTIAAISVLWTNKSGRQSWICSAAGIGLAMFVGSKFRGPHYWPGQVGCEYANSAWYYVPWVLGVVAGVVVSRKTSRINLPAFAIVASVMASIIALIASRTGIAIDGATPYSRHLAMGFLTILAVLAFTILRFSNDA